MSTFSERLRYQMNTQGIRLVDLAEKTGIKKPQLSEYVNGGYEPKQRNLYKIALALGVKPGYLMGLTDAEQGDTDTQPYYLDSETARLAQEARDNPDLRMLFDASRKLSPQDLKTVTALVRSLTGDDTNG